MHNDIYLLRLFCLFLICLAGIRVQYAQDQPASHEYLIEALTIEDGLPFRDVTAINQDADGIMWFGTTQGLIRYGGYQFKLYNSDKENPCFIPEEAIGVNSIACADNQFLWYLGHSKLFLLDTKTDHYAQLGNENGIQGNVVALQLDAEDNVWIVTDNFFTRQDISTPARQTLRKQISPDSFAVIHEVPRAQSGITNLTAGPDQTIWWSTITKGQLAFSADGKFIRQMQPDSAFARVEEADPGLTFFNSRDEMFFLDGKNEVSNYDTQKGRFNSVIKGKDSFYTAKEDASGNCWFGSVRTIYMLAPDGTCTDMTPFIREHLAFGETHQFFSDQQGVFWIATDFGLVKLKPKNRFFEPFLKTDEESLTSTMRGFVETADGSVIVMNEHQRKLYKILPDHKVTQFNISGDAGMSATSVLDAARFFVTDESRHFLYTANKYLVRIDLENGTCFVDTSFSPYPNIRSLNPIEMLDDGRLVAGHTLATLQIYDPVSRKTERLLANPSPIPNIENVRFLLESCEPGMIWIGTHENGAYKARIGGEIFTQLSTYTDPGIPKNAVLVMHEAPDTSLWIGTFGGGLSHYEPESNTVMNYDRNVGLADNNVVGILPETDSVLWVSTYNGLSRFNTTQESFRNFTVEDGLTHNEFNYASFFKDRKGMFYFGGMNGFIRFDPDDHLGQNPYPAPIFTLFTKYDQRENEAHNTDLLQNDLDHLTISPYDVYFQVHWTMTNYFDNQENRYYTKLEGLDDDWNYLENRSFIRYYRLDPGKYVLRVKATDPKGNEASGELSIPIIVRPVFYRTWWFAVLSVLLLSGIIYAVFQYRLNQLLKIEKLRTKISSDLHDDLGSMLSGLAMQSELLEMNAPEEERPQLRNITTTSRKAVHRMRDLVWSIDSRKDRVSDLAEKMRETAEDLLLPAGFKYDLHIDGFTNERKKLTINVRQNLFLIFKEALHNIIKHSNGDTVQVRLEQEGGRVLLLIRDNGTPKYKGMYGTEPVQSTGQGLMNMQMRTKHLKGNFQYTQTDGFEIRVDFPANHIFM